MLLPGATVRDLDRLTARVLDTATHSSGARFHAYRIDDQFLIDISLPGTDPAAVEITQDDQGLTVRAERRGAGGAAGDEVSLSAALDTDRLRCHYANGVLTLSIPASGNPASDRIEVGAGVTR